MEQRSFSSVSYRWALLIAGALLVLLIGGLFRRPMAAPKAQAAAQQATIAITQTVGTETGICAPHDVIAVVPNTIVHYCIILRNSDSNASLSRHTLSSSLLGRSVTFTQTLNPGDDIALTTNVFSSLGQHFDLSTIITQTRVGTIIPNTVTITSTNDQGIIATGYVTANVVIGTVGVKVTKTVGLTGGRAGCTIAKKGIAVNSNTVVYYCVTFQSTGTLPLKNHYLYDPLLNIGYGFEATIASGTPVAITNEDRPELAHVITQSITNTVFFTSTTAEGISVSTQDQAIVLVGRPSIDLAYTIGSDTDPCGSTTSLTIVSGRPIQHCLRLSNNGAIPFETHNLLLVQNSNNANTQLLNTTITQTLQPGESIVINSARFSQLAQASVTAAATYTFTVTSRNGQGISASATPKGAKVTIGAATLTAQKYASIDRNVCITRPLPTAMSITSNQPFYYCLVVANTGQIPFVRHTFREGAPLNISGDFTYTLAPGQRITITNDFLTSTLGLRALFGPFTAAGQLGAMVYTAYSASNTPTSLTASIHQIAIATLTLTPTPQPTPIPTLTPTISPTPTPSLPPPPTLTPTPVVVSFQPLPTTAFGIDAITTPTPGANAAGQPLSPLDGLAPTIDFTSTAIMQTAEAATQIALALIPPPVTDTPIPLPTDTPFPPTATETVAPTPTEVVTPTITPVVLVLAPLPTPAPTGDYLDLAAQVFQVSTATLGWLWFLGGSIIFFATAGVFAGLSLRQRRTQRNEVVADIFTDTFTMAEDGNLADYTFDPTATDSILAPDPRIDQTTDDDDYWPPSLR